MEAHKFHTLYCQGLLKEGKQNNIEKLRQKTMKNEMSGPKAEEPAKNKKIRKEDLKKKAGLLSKGIQTMLRLTSGNHLKIEQHG